MSRRINRPPRGFLSSLSAFGGRSAMTMWRHPRWFLLVFAHGAELVARTGNIDVIRLFAKTLMRMATGELHQDMSAYTYGQSTIDYFNRQASSGA